MKEALRHADASVRRRALEAVEGAQEDDVITALGAALRDPDDGVRRAAKAALRRAGVVPSAAPPARGGS